MTRTFLALLALAVILGSFAACGAKSIEIGGIVYQSLDIDKAFTRVVGQDSPPRPPSDLGPLTFATVRVYAQGKQDRKLLATTDKDGRFSVTLPGKLFGAIGPVEILFRQEGYKSVRFTIDAEDLRRYREEAGGRTHYLEYWVPFLEPD